MSFDDFDSPAALAFTTSLEIDAAVHRNVDYLFRLRSEELKDAFLNFNISNQTISSLLSMNTTISIFTIPFLYLVYLNYEYCNTPFEWLVWYFAIISIPILNIVVWYVYLGQREVIKQNHGRLPIKSRKFIQQFQIYMVYVLHILAITRFLTKIVAGRCHEIYNPAENWNCNQHAPSRAIPVEAAYLTTATPMLFAILARGAHFEHTMVMWASSVISLVFALFYADAANSVLYVLYSAVGSLMFIIETRKLNYFLFFTAHKLHDILLERKKQADEANANEMRHMIANVAHDLKTVSWYPYLSSYDCCR